MTDETKPATAPAGIDVCSGPALTRAERLAQEATRFAPSPPKPPAPKPAQPTPLPQAAE